MIATGNVLRALEQAMNFTAECIEQFAQRDKEAIQAEQENTRFQIRFIDQTLFETHVRFLNAYLEIDA